MQLTDKVSGSSSVELVGKVLGITSLVYGIGLVSINLSFFFWGFHDFDIPNQQAIYAGVLALLFVVTIYLPVAVAKDRIANLDLLKKHKWWTISFGLLFICTVPWVVYWQHAGIQTFLRGHHSESLNVILVIQAIVFSASFISIGQETRRVILSNDEKVSTASLLTGGLLTIFLGFSLLLLFACVYIRIPVSIGGGEPEQRDMWVSREALNVFDYCKGAPIPKDQQIQRFETQDPNIVFLPNLFVLHESKDNFIIWREKGRIVALPKAWIKTYEWPMPDHK